MLMSSNDPSKLEKARPSFVLVGEPPSDVGDLGSQSLVSEVRTLLDLAESGQADLLRWQDLPRTEDDLDARLAVIGGADLIVVADSPHGRWSPGRLLSLFAACVDRRVRLVVPAEGVDSAFEVTPPGDSENAA